MKWLNYGLLGLMAVLCLVRSVVEVKRMLTEQPTLFHPEITVCGPQPAEMEQLLVWNFRNLGAECK